MIKDIWQKLENQKAPYIERAKALAKISIPMLFPETGANSSTAYEPPFQSLGAKGTGNLASKLILTLFPVGIPPFRYQIDDFTLEDLTKDPNLRGEVERQLASFERAVLTHLEGTNFRSKAHELLKLLIVTGSGLMKIDDDGTCTVYNLYQFCVKRAPDGTLLELVIKLKLHPEAIEDVTLRDYLLKVTSDADPYVDLYTYCRKEDGYWNVSQEVNDLPVGKEGKYDDDSFPYICPTLLLLSGEDYGRALLEEHEGDLLNYEKLSKCLMEYAAQASRFITLVNPASVTKPKQLTEAASGSYLPGMKDDVIPLETGKTQDFSLVINIMPAIERRLGQAFLLLDGAIRDSERTTALEIQATIQALEESHAGLFGLLSQTFQLQVIKRYISLLTKKKKLPKLPKETAEPKITTGIDSLGRGQDFNKLSTFAQFVVGLPPQPPQELKVGELLLRTATALGIDTNGLLKSPEELQAEMEQAQQMQMMQQIASPIAQNISRGMVEGDPEQAQ